MASSRQEPAALVPAREFARTYQNRVYEDPWRTVEDYRKVMEWTTENPRNGATSIANRFDLPRGRVEGWLDGSRPNSVRGIEIAREQGWIQPDPNSATFRGLNALVAWTLQSGSITSDTWVPFLTVGTEHDRKLLSTAANLAGVALDLTRSAGALRSQELRPIEHGSVLGRVLVVLGAPQGTEREKGDVSLPDYLNHVPERLAKEFVQSYLHNLGRNHDGRYYIHLRPSHSDNYRQSVAQLVQQLTGEQVSVIEQNIVLSKPATHEVAVWEPLLDIDA